MPKSLGLDFLAITDHNNISHLAALNTIDTPLMLIPGLEVTTYKGHWNIWGDRGWIDFRIEDEAHMAQAIAEANRRGYLTSINHPRPFGPDWEYPAVDKTACIEVWNGPWVLMNDIALEFWESRLRAGKRYTAVGGSDNHFLKQEHIAKLGVPTLWIYCPGVPSPAKLLDAMRAGHVSISESPTGARLFLDSSDAMMGDIVAQPADGMLPVALRVIDGAGSTLEVHTAAGCVYSQAVTSDDARYEVVVDVAQSPYVRAQLVTSGDQTQIVRALTNPIYIR